MTVSVEKLADAPILIVTFAEPSSPTDQAAMWAAIAPLVEALEAPIYRITDLSKLDVKFGQMVGAIAYEAKGNLPGSAADPRVRSVLVTTSAIVEIAAKSLAQAQYGQIAMPPMFTTRDAALAHCQAELAKAVSAT
jgi:hypothetical protein